MSGTTPIYGWRYSTTGDQPNGPIQIEDLALDVETSLHTTDTNVAKKTILVAKPASTAHGSLGAGSSVVMASYTIADPGWAYHIKAEAMVDFSSATSGTALLVSVNVDSTVYNTNAITQGHGTTFGTSLNTDVNADCNMGNSKAMQPAGYTGSHTLSLVVKAGAATVNVFDGINDDGHGLGDKYEWNIEIVPV